MEGESSHGHSTVNFMSPRASSTRPPLGEELGGKQKRTLVQMTLGQDWQALLWLVTIYTRTKQDTLSADRLCLPNARYEVHSSRSTRNWSHRKTHMHKRNFLYISWRCSHLRWATVCNKLRAHKWEYNFHFNFLASGQPTTQLWHWSPKTIIQTQKLAPGSWWYQLVRTCNIPTSGLTQDCRVRTSNGSWCHPKMRNRRMTSC